MGGWQTKFSVSPGPGLWSLVLGPFGPDLGPELDKKFTSVLDVQLSFADNDSILNVIWGSSYQ